MASVLLDISVRLEVPPPLQTFVPPVSYPSSAMCKTIVLTVVCAVLGRYGSRRRLWNVTCSGLCREGYFCPAGATSETERECGDSSVYCPEGSEVPQEVSKGYYSIGGSGPSTRAAQQICDMGYYCSEKSGIRIPCPAGTYGATLGLSNPVGPVFDEVNAASCSGLCSPGHYCPPNSTSPEEVPCPAGTYGREYGLTDGNCTAVCPVGHFCPEGSVEPTKCPPGRTMHASSNY